jgi:hypothetical protein
MGIRIFIFSLFAMLAVSVDSRPVSYPGGYTLMIKSDNAQNSAYLHYSPTYKYAIGVEAKKDKRIDDQYSLLRFTYLVNRKNTDNSQRNLYFQSGYSFDSTENSFFGFHGDWETRRYLIGFDVKKVASIEEDYSEQKYQIGFAPYLGEYGDLHTWIMLKTSKNSITDKTSTYPCLKFFKGDNLLELGYNGKTNWGFHFMHRF